MRDSITEANQIIKRINDRKARDVERRMRKAPVIEDGFGNAWANWCHECERYSLHVVRPGKVQCDLCGR